MTRPFGDPEVLATAHKLVDELAARIASPTPLRLCDAADWDWRAYLSNGTSRTG